MAVQISDGGAVPHATNYSDLLAKLKTFITANGWTSIASTSTEEYFKGSGGGTDQIFVGIQKFADVPNDNYAWLIQGLTGYVPAVGFNSQPGAIQGNVPALPLWNNTIPYWFVCSSRRVIVLAKISSLYMSAYFGWMLPYATPSQWPYPHVIGGSTYAPTATGIPYRYSTVDANMSAFCIPQNGTPGTLCVRDPAGTWQRPVNRDNVENSVYTYFDSEGVWPWNNQLQDQTYNGWFEQEKTLDGQYSLQPAVVLGESARNQYGELDSVYHIAGRGNAVENIVVRNGVNHIVWQNVFRTAKDAYLAVKLA